MYKVTRYIPRSMPFAEALFFTAFILMLAQAG